MCLVGRAERLYVADLPQDRSRLCTRSVKAASLQQQIEFDEDASLSTLPRIWQLRFRPTSAASEKSSMVAAAEEEYAGQGASLEAGCELKVNRHSPVLLLA